MNFPNLASPPARSNGRIACRNFFAVTGFGMWVLVFDQPSVVAFGFAHQPDKRMIEIARKIIARQEGDFEPGKCAGRSEGVLRDLIRRKSG